MSAKYVCEESAGYLATRNEIYRLRAMQLEQREAKAQAVLRNLPEQSKENYGKKEMF